MFISSGTNIGLSSPNRITPITHLKSSKNGTKRCHSLDSNFHHFIIKEVDIGIGGINYSFLIATYLFNICNNQSKMSVQTFSGPFQGGVGGIIPAFYNSNYQKSTWPKEIISFCKSIIFFRKYTLDNLGAKKYCVYNSQIVQREEESRCGKRSFDKLGKFLLSFTKFAGNFISNSISLLVYFGAFRWAISSWDSLSSLCRSRYWSIVLFFSCL